MYVISRKIKVDKTYAKNVLSRFSDESPVFNFKGFIKREIFLESKAKEIYDVVCVMIYFEDKQAYYKWEGSKEHIAMHKDKNHAHNKKPEGVIGVESNYYEQMESKPYRETVI